MSIRTYAYSLAAATLLTFSGGSPSQALTMKECSVKYEAAKEAGSLNGMKWNDFRKAECGPDASPAPDTTASVGGSTSTSDSNTNSAPALAPAPSIIPGDAVFPNSISAQYSSESAGKARMMTCLDQYRANKANGGNGNLKWIQKGGGYYSECNTRLKGG